MDLSEPFRPGIELPMGSKMELIKYQLSDIAFHVATVYTFEERVHKKALGEIAKGRAMIPVFREGPWSVKKALVHLLMRLPGHHMHCSVV